MIIDFLLMTGCFVLIFGFVVLLLRMWNNE